MCVWSCWWRQPGCIKLRGNRDRGHEDGALPRPSRPANCHSSYFLYVIEFNDLYFSQINWLLCPAARTLNQTQWWPNLFAPKHACL
jgi:hypothetical protein